MLDADDDLVKVLQESHEAAFEVSAFYGDTPTVPGPNFPDLDFVPLDSSQGDLSFSGSSVVQGSGSMFIAANTDSLVPKSKTDPLAPYGQEIAINYRVSKGGLSWTVPLGRYRITEVPDSREYFARYPSQMALVGWSAQIDFKDRFDLIDHDDFLAATGPTKGNTVWQEIQALSPIPIVQSLDDAAIPAGITYQGRMDAITQLLSAIGGVPHMTRQGALTARPADAWLTATESVFNIDGVIDMSDGMSNSLYNSVAVTNPNDENVLAIVEITDAANPLRVDGPLGRRTYTNSNPLATSNATAKKIGQTILSRVSTQQSRTVQVECLPNPLIELGDFGTVTDPNTERVVTGEVTSLRFPLDPTASMQMELTVAEVL